MRLTLSVLSAVLVLTGCGRTPPPATETAVKLTYPATAKVEQTDTYHGTPVADPYRWLEGLETPEVKSWVAAQNALAEPYLAGIPARPALIARLTELWNYERYSVPREDGGRYFYTRNDGLQDQPVLHVLDQWGGTPRVLLDPNTLSKDGTVSLGAWTPSPDGKLLAWSVSDGGSDWRIWRVRDVTTGADLGDELRYAKFDIPVAWRRDGKGFYYTRHPVGAGPDYKGDDSQPLRVWYHKVGSNQADDKLVYDVGHPTRNPYGVQMTEDGRHLVVTIFDTRIENAVHVLSMDTLTPTPRKLFDAWDAQYYLVGNDGPVLFFKTTKDAPLSRVVAVDLRETEPVLREVVPQAAEALDDASFVGGHLIASYLRDARSLIKVHDRTGKLVREVALPGLGTASGFGGHGDRPETFYSYTDFTTPTAIHRYDVTKGESTLFQAARTGARLDGIITEQVFVTSKDGTKVPMFIVRRKDLVLDGSHPTLLYGYGGFNQSYTPAYSTSRAVWLERGGIYVLANIRGGGEYGHAWHEAGTRLKKQNVFDDFIAAAEHLIAAKYTRPDRLAVQGGSNGGLLVGAVVNQRPDLFGAALPAVGVMDMLRYHTAGQNPRLWAADYGLSEDEAEFRAQLAYSPIHNIKAGVCHPATLVTTGDHDDRVVPWHSYKYAAALQAAQGCDRPVLLRVETRAGHGAGKPTWMQIEEVADWLAFLVRHLGMPDGATG
jgi:prolyl oligopeptidase